MTNKAAPAIAGTAADQAGGDLTSKNDFQAQLELELGRDLDRLVELGLVEIRTGGPFAVAGYQLTAAGNFAAVYGHAPKRAEP